MMKQDDIGSVRKHLKCVILIMLISCIIGCGKNAEENDRSDAASLQESSIEELNQNTSDAEDNMIREDAISDETYTSDIRESDYEDNAAEKIKDQPAEELDTRQDSVSDDIEIYLEKMSIEQKVAQLLFTTPEGLTGKQQVTEFGKISKEKYDDIPVGGLYYSSGSLQNPAQTKALLKDTQDYATEATGIPVFLGIDEEGGRVLRVGNQEVFGVKKIEPMYQVAQSGGEEAVSESANYIGSYLADLGFNTDFAPDADVFTNADNTVIGDRSFSSDPDEVARMARTYANGLKNAGILTTYKHFPGHGNTSEDSHEGYAYSYKTLEELEKCELIPFKDGADGCADFIMVSHISTPKITGDNTPASLSYKIVTELLRQELGYDGVVITDALGMGAISEHYSLGESGVLAIEAGCDMLLMSGDVIPCYEAVLAAVNEGRITKDRIDESVRRILKLKMSRLLVEDAPELDKDVSGVINEKTDEQINDIYDETADKEWKEAYITTIKSTQNHEKGSLTDVDFDLMGEFSYSLIYIDDNEIPELAVEDDIDGIGTIYTYHNDQIVDLDFTPGWYHGTCSYYPKHGYILMNSVDGAGSVQYYSFSKLLDGKIESASVFMKSEVKNGTDGEYIFEFFTFDEDNNEIPISKEEFLSLFEDYGNCSLDDYIVEMQDYKSIFANGLSADEMLLYLQGDNHKS
ncbi:glycoside hydrolase family 3 protein [Butyrivibrio sp. JL13D10]|uniref:glycoside hydrolase family 3 protein n=1 Tax=Butyrivibrio sp. JL13D10 TaxID=3236815 RepID=UPI0038B43F9F